MKRRHFLQDLLRYPVLALLIALGIYVRKGADDRVVTCQTPGNCQECNLSKRCSLKSGAKRNPLP